MTKINFFKSAGLFLAFISIGIFTSCSEDDGTTTTVDDPIASFQFEASASNFLEVTFSNFSQNATSYSWDFGDGSAASTTESPVYEYAETGNYTVTLTATNDAGTSKTKSETVAIIDPLESQRILIGDNGKVWQFIEDGVPFEVQPTDNFQFWWAFGVSAELCQRPCIFDDTWTFNTDGTFTYDNNGDFWKEGSIWGDEECGDATDASIWTVNGNDLSGWDSGTHDFVYDFDNQQIKVTGGFIGKMNSTELGDVTVPAESVTYDVVKLVDADVDTLIIQVINDDAASTNTGQIYWRSTLVSYDNPADDVIVIEDCEEKPMVDVTFSLNMNDYEGAFTTPEVNGTFNGWCGNCNAMSDTDADGIWEVTVNIDGNTDYEYKFAFDSWAGQESLTPESSCTLTTGENTNRTLTTTDVNVTVGTVCWNSCDNCPE